MKNRFNNRDSLIGIMAIVVGVLFFYVFINKLSNALLIGDKGETQISTEEKTKEDIDEKDDIKTFNENFEVFEGKRSGKEIKLLIDVVELNIMNHLYESDKLPDIVIEENKMSVGKPRIINSITKGLGVESDDPNYTDYNFDKTIRGLDSTLKSIDINHDYYVELHYNSETGYIDSIGIFYFEPKDKVLYKDVSDYYPLLPKNINSENITRLDDLKTEEEKNNEKIEKFNKVFEDYNGIQEGSRIRQLLSDIISETQKNKDDENCLPDLVYIPTENDLEDPFIIHSLNGGMGRAVRYSQLVNEEFDEKFTIPLISQARTNIETNHTYFVELHYNSVTGFIDSIGIFYNEPNGNVLIQDVDDEHPLIKILGF